MCVCMCAHVCVYVRQDNAGVLMRVCIILCVCVRVCWFLCVGLYVFVFVCVCAHGCACLSEPEYTASSMCRVSVFWGVCGCEIVCVFVSVLCVC